MTRFTTLWAPRVSHANKIPGVCWMRIVMLWETKTSTGHFGVLRRLLRLITTYCLALLCLYLFSPFFSSSAALLHTHVYYYSFTRSLPSVTTFDTLSIQKRRSLEFSPRPLRSTLEEALLLFQSFERAH